MHDVICLGSATMDVFVETEKQTATTEVIDGKETPFITYRSGEKVLINHLKFEVGGGGTNTAVCFSRLGLRTAYVGNIGLDTNGELVVRKLQEEHVDFLGTRTDDLTNYSVVLESTLLHDRTILVYKGASERLLFNSLPGLFCKFLYVSSLAGESFRTAYRVMERAKQDGTKVAFNPSNYQIEHDRNDVLRMLALADILVLNREEAVLLVGDGTERELLERLRGLGPSIVAVTLGSKGAAVSDGQAFLFAPPTPNLPVKETTGAGDCFASSFVAAHAYGKPLQEALLWAFVNVENHIQHVGAKAGLFTKAEMQYALARDSREIHSL